MTTESTAAPGITDSGAGVPATPDVSTVPEIIPADFSKAVFNSSFNDTDPTPNPEPTPAPATVVPTPDPIAKTEVTQPAGDNVPQIFTLDGAEILPGAATPAETPTEKAFRERAEAAENKLKELTASNPQPTELKEPDLWDEEIGGDQEKYKTAMREYYVEQGKREAKTEGEQRAAVERQQREEIRLKDAVANYDRRREAVKASLPDIDAADIMLARELPQVHQIAILSSGVENTEMVAYALYRNEELRKQFAAETNPIRLGVMIADISKRANLAPKAPAEPVNKEPVVKGAQGGKPSSEMPSKFSGATFKTA